MNGYLKDGFPIEEPMDEEPRCECGQPSSYWWRDGIKGEPLGICDDCDSEKLALADAEHSGRA